jgi:hypothetical protein
MLEEYTSASFILLNDIDLASFTNLTQSFINTTFTGNLSGQGFTISNLKINGSNNSENLALIRVLSDAAINNLVLENFNITGGSRIAAMASHLTQNITLSNINVSGGFLQVTTFTNAFRPAGPLAATADFASIFAENIQNSMNADFIEQAGGGVFGWIGNSNVILRNVTQSGILSGPNSSRWIGGIIGLVEINTNITMTGILISGGNISAGREVGGLIGLFKGINLNGTDVTLNNVSVTANNGSIHGHIIANLNQGNITFRNINVTDGADRKLVHTTIPNLTYSNGDEISKIDFLSANIN